MADANIRAVITADDRASGVLKNFASGLDGIGRQALDVAKRVAQVGAAAAAAGAILGVKTAADLESARMGFITLLGSATKADDTLRRIKQEAARTPFEMVGLTQATQLLASVTKDGDRALDFILDIGEGLAAMGRGQAELDRISVNLQQIAATGRAASIDIKQFAFAGIPIYEMLQKETGKAGEALEEFITQGGVTFDMLEKMFANATSEGGRFFGAYKNQLGTFNQQWSNLKDTFAQTAAEIVIQTGLFTFLKDAMGKLGQWVTDHKEEIIAFLQGLGTVLGAVFSAGAFAVRILIDTFEWLRAKYEQVSAFIASNPQIQNVLGLIRDAANLAKNVIEMFLLPVIRQLLHILGPVARFVFNEFKNTFGGIFALGIAGLDSAVSSLRTLIGWIQSAINKMNEFNQKVTNTTGGVFSAGNILKNALGTLGLGLLPGRAVGGPVSSGQPYVVGERGPELFVPNNSGKIVPNNQMGGSTTQITIAPNIGIYAGTEIEKRKLAKELFDSLRDIAASQNKSVMELLA